MPVIEIEAFRKVRYNANVEVTDEQAERFRLAVENEDRQEIQNSLDQWIDGRYDVSDAENYEPMNLLIDDELLDFNL